MTITCLPNAAGGLQGACAPSHAIPAHVRAPFWCAWINTGAALRAQASSGIYCGSRSLQRRVRPRRDQRPACSNLRIQPACADSLQQRGVALARRGTTWHGHGSVTTPARRHVRSRASTRRDQRPVFCGSTHPTGPLKFPASGRPGVSDGAWRRFAATASWMPARYSRAGAPDGSPAWGRTVRPEGRRLRPGS